MNNDKVKVFSLNGERQPVWLRIAIASIAILYFGGYSIYTSKEWKRNKEKFYKEGFSALVMYKDNNSDRFYEYHLDNELKVCFKIADTTSMAEGDSVVKDANTYYYSVYRKNADGSYIFLSTYNFDESPFN